MHRGSPPSLEDEGQSAVRGPNEALVWRPTRVPEWRSPSRDSHLPDRDAAPAVMVLSLPKETAPRLVPALVCHPEDAGEATSAAAQDLLPAREGERGTANESISERPVPGNGSDVGAQPVDAIPPPPPPPPSLPVRTTATLQAKKIGGDASRTNETAHADDLLGRFAEMRRQSVEFHDKVKWNYDQVAVLETRHEREAAAYRDAVNAKLSHQQQLIDTSQAELQRSKETIKAMKEEYDSLAQRASAAEQECYTSRVQMARLEQASRHAEDRARIAEVGRGIAEVRQKEAETAMAYMTSYVEELYTKLTTATADREAALLNQYKAFEENREQLIAFFDKREAALVSHLSATARKVYAEAQEASAETTAAAVAHWKELYDGLTAQYKRLEESVERRKLEAEREWAEKNARLETEAARRQAAQNAEREAAWEAMQKREETLTRSMTLREAALQAREQKMLEEHAAFEESCTTAMRRRELELKAHNETALLATKDAFEKERERLLDSFTDQLQKISNMHLDNERELERMHREKEREMAQRYRQTSDNLGERESRANLKDSTSSAKETLLSSFDTIESKQRARAEQLRAQMKAGVAQARSTHEQ